MAKADWQLIQVERYQIQIIFFYFFLKFNLMICLLKNLKL